MMHELGQQQAELYFIESLSPRFTPEIAFQSYEMLDGDKSSRDAQMAQFLAGDVANPTLDYPLIDEQVMQTKISILERKLAETQVIKDEKRRTVIWDTISYRMAEMYWLLESTRLNRLFQDRGQDSPDFIASLHRFQDANETLYGEPDEVLTDKVLGEIWSQIESKPLDANGEKLLHELRNGTSMMINGENVIIPPLPRSKSGERLPENLRERLVPLRESLLEEFTDVKRVIDEYYQNVCLNRAESDPQRGVFTVADMQAVFIATRNLRDPDNDAGIEVRVNDTASALAWDTPTMSVVVGGKRAPIDTPLEMLAKVVHEYGVHGMRAVNGKKSTLPILGAGLFTDAHDGESTDYLTFEEGFASLCETAILDKEQGWEPLYISRYIVAVSTYAGLDFRQSFEQNWRVCVLMSAKEGSTIDDKLIKREKEQAYISTVRLRRGSPTTYTGHEPVSFNKDLAYLKGKVKALEYLESTGFDQIAIRRLFTAKFDPTNKLQDALVDEYGII